MALNPFATLAVVSIFALSLHSAQAQDNVLSEQQQNNIVYVTGGIGKDESDALRATQANYNLRVMNADKVGHFSSDTRIIIRDLQNNILLDATSGPLFYANLPKGRYIIQGFVGLQSKMQPITIAAGKTANVRFVWRQDATDIPNE